MRYFGLDLAGYSSGRSGLAELSVQEGAYEAIVYRKHPFCRRVEGRDALADTVAAERLALNKLTSVGTLFVDVPIELGTLLTSSEAAFVWELTARPVDFAFGGLRPLADRIGASVARFRNLLHEQDISKVRETYPAASLESSGLAARQYKEGLAVWEIDRWVGGPLANLARDMRLMPGAPMRLTNDDFDAIVCAYAGAAPSGDILTGAALTDVVRQRVSGKLRAQDLQCLKRIDAPTNYQLFKAGPRIDIQIRDLDWKDFQSIAAELGH